ncbi:hypothetical protein [Leptotrichia massiliensis]|uniref:hypothetical protein n=1 Tax=Leptotrichia massiliensis TaxID=1852388 RepID=UPI001F2A6487|nr:hypothetical protein [Leptotrichia massiliensis]
MVKMKMYHRSRKFLIVILGIIFLSSVSTLKLRGYQRKNNLTTIRNELKGKTSERIFEDIEEKSKREDLWLLIGTNAVALMLIVGFDRFGVFEESDETIKENKKKLVKLFL